MSIAIAGCGTVGAIKKTVLGGDDSKPGQHLTGFIGGVAADEPRAALSAREILATGGNAADAAVALGFMLTATYPSRASLGAGGACVAYQPGRASPNKGVPEAIMFLSRAPAGKTGDRPAAVPMLARGLYLLSARYGTKPFEALVSPAEQIARFGHPVSRALARDLTAVGAPLAGDPAAAAIFAPGGIPLGEGARLIQGDLGGTLSQLRSVGVGDMYQGLLAHKLAEASAEAGGPIAVDDLRAALPSLAMPVIAPAGVDKIAFLPPPADGGVAAAAAFETLQANPAAGEDAANRSLAAAASARGLSGLPALPASTSFVVVDRRGQAVSCALTMGNLFGTGRVAPGTGIVLAASPSAKPAPLLTAAIAWNENLNAFRAAIGASGQNAAALAGAVALTQAFSGELPPANPVPDPGRANAIGCPRYLPGADSLCRWATDSRGAGLAAGGG